MKKEAKLRFGKICEKHPHLNGARYWASYACVACAKARATAASILNYHNDEVKRERIKANARERNRERKLAIVSHYGGKCQLCEVDDIDVLTVDHIGGGGNAHRRSMSSRSPNQKWGIGPNSLHHWVVKNGFPSNIRVLCFNCNVKDHLVRQRARYQNNG